MLKYPSLSPFLVPPSSSSRKYFSSSSFLLPISLINFYPFYTVHLLLPSQILLHHLSLSSAVASLSSPLPLLWAKFRCEYVFAENVGNEKRRAYLYSWN